MNCSSPRPPARRATATSTAPANQGQTTFSRRRVCAGPRRTSGKFAGAYNSYSEVPMKYRIALHKSEEGYSVSVPGLPGCWSQGATEQEALENIREAIREYLSVVNEQLRGEDIREIEVTAQLAEDSGRQSPRRRALGRTVSQPSMSAGTKLRS